MTQKNTHDSSPIGAGVTGFILGVAGASAVILSDEETRKKVAKKAHIVKENVKKWSQKTMDTVSSEKKEITKKLEEKKG